MPPTKTRAESLMLQNQCLDALHELFPEADVGDLRYRINSKFQEHAELSEQLKMLLEHSQMGRKLKKRIGNNETLQPWEMFRSSEYIKAVEYHLRKEFKSLSRSTILGVMAENNNHFTKSRMVLIDINRKSWRHKITSWIFLRPKPEEPRAIPKLGPTGCAELDEELWELNAPSRKEQAASDLALARVVNEREYKECDALLECECCFGDYAFETMVACCFGHLFCHSCVFNAVNEGIYGQTTSLMRERGTIRCLSSVADPPCDQHVPLDLVLQALPVETIRAMEDRFIEDDIIHSGLPIAKCPFCMYAETDEVPDWTVRKGATYTTIALGLFVASANFLLVLFLAFAVLFALSYIYLLEVVSAPNALYFEHVISTLINRAVKQKHEKTRGQVFQCKNDSETCGRKSCRSCRKEWRAFHKCFENEEEALRICVENAMAAAIKRTCPTCGTSFVKSDGCNKLTCVCGYVMCYICRADLKGIGYKHFCQHFRQVPGTPCAECDRCDLYVQEDETLVLKSAGEQAQAEWLSKNPGVTGWKPPQRQVIAGYTLKANRRDATSAVQAFREQSQSIKEVLEQFLSRVLEKFIELKL
ncbi:hypothetical protein TWF970_002227 [Orbilia oligospora]|uniref:RING-type domain-containing protein n=1 Tax=Orbilia oligospora TaxID=2813651 RepID=A0A7C8VCW4_ORBOL|nr:hypothetical protein TWF970_002227 [Orbilia oligospora]